MQQFKTNALNNLTAVLIKYINICQPQINKSISYGQLNF